jgi:hypothetical protein
MVIAHHLVMNGYGTWLSNDLRGSGSTEVRKLELRDLGPIHFGRKLIQPTRSELKAFHREAEPLLDFDVAWFDAAARDCISDAARRVISDHGYICYAWSNCSNHSHGMIRAHRDPGHLMWQHFADATRDALRESGLFSSDHPVWSDRPYVVFKHDVRAVETGIEYIIENPTKEGLPVQKYDFVTPYDGWPLHKRRGR